MKFRRIISTTLTISGGLAWLLALSFAFHRESSGRAILVNATSDLRSLAVELGYALTGEGEQAAQQTVLASLQQQLADMESKALSLQARLDEEHVSTAKARAELAETQRQQALHREKAAHLQRAFDVVVIERDVAVQGRHALSVELSELQDKWSRDRVELNQRLSTLVRANQDLVARLAAMSEPIAGHSHQVSEPRASRSSGYQPAPTTSRVVVRRGSYPTDDPALLPPGTSTRW